MAKMSFWRDGMAIREACSRDLSRLGRNDSLLEGEAAIEAALTGLDHAIGLARKVIEGEALDRAHGPGLAFRFVDLNLHFRLDRRDLLRLADNLHPECRMVDEAVERH